MTIFFRRSLVIVLLAIVAAHETVGFCQQSTLQTKKTSQTDSAILRNMPMNSEKRCVGISAVTEALLEGKHMGTGFRVSMEVCARQIYERVISGEQVQYPATFLMDGKEIVASDRLVLERLSTLVTDLYKRDFNKLSETQAGITKLNRANRKIVRSLSELDQILDADSDHIEFFCCVGSRRFTNGEYQVTNHAALIKKLASGVKVVYDPNDPGTPLDCKFYEEKQGLTIEWTCKYRGTGRIATQRYQIIPKEKYFHSIHGAGSMLLERWH